MKWSIEQDLDVCSFYLLNSECWRDRIKSYYEVFKNYCDEDVSIGTLKMRIQNYQYLHTNGEMGLSKVCKQEKNVYRYLTHKSFEENDLVRHQQIMIAREEEKLRNQARVANSKFASSINDSFSMQNNSFITVVSEPDKMDFYTLMFDLGEKHGYDTRYKIAKAACIDQGTFKKKVDNNSKLETETVAKICLGMHLTYLEAKQLFKKAYRDLSGENFTDVLIDHCLEHGIYDQYEIDMTLLSHKQKPLFDTSLDQESLKEYIEDMKFKRG